MKLSLRDRPISVRPDGIRTLRVQWAGMVWTITHTEARQLAREILQITEKD